LGEPQALGEPQTPKGKYNDTVLLSTPSRTTQDEDGMRTGSVTPFLTVIWLQTNAHGRKDQTIDL
jgi:hypothetical protein